MAKTLAAVGIDTALSFDLHSVKVPEVFSLPLVHLSAIHLFADVIKSNGGNSNNSVLVSPDMGGIHRVKQLSEIVNLPYIAIEKERDLASGHIEAARIGKHSEISIQGKRAIIVDDMISSGHTMVKAIELLQKSGVQESIIFATHAIFSEDAPRILQESGAKQVFVTDSVLVPQHSLFPKLQILSIAQMTAHALSQL
jgi:ribose-phosphate pyrophosphokinase